MTQKKRSNPKSNPVKSKINQRIDSAETLISSGDSEQRVSALIKENAKIVQKYSAAKAELVTANNLIAALTEELKPHRRSPTSSHEELMNELAPLIIQEIKKLGGWKKYCDHHAVSPEP